MEEMHRTKLGERVWDFHTLSQRASLPSLNVFTNPKLSEPSCLGVLKVLLQRYD